MAPIFNNSSIAAAWQDAGGNPDHVVVAIAVALAESGGDVNAVSGANWNGTRDYGLWQINSVHFGEFGITDPMQALDPNTNARMAIAISGNGSNWGPWCTAWANPSRDCATGPLSYPQTGSPAYNRIAQAQTGISAGVPIANAPTGATGSNIDPSTPAGLTTAWDELRWFFGQGAADKHTAMTGLQSNIGGIG